MSENVIQTFQSHKEELDEDDLWSGILAAVTCAVHATAHTTLRTTPVKFVFGRDAVSNTKFETSWQAIQQRKQAIMNENDARENKKQTPHTHRV